MSSPNRCRSAFTLIEMLVVMAIISILAAILLHLNSLVQSKAARARTEGEIRALAAGCEAYKADNGSFPQDVQPTAAASVTDSLDPRTSGDPSTAAYKNSSLFLYKQLSGDANANGRNEPAATPPENKAYLSDFFTPQRLAVDVNKSEGTVGRVLYLKDYYGNSFAYSTKGAAAEQAYRVAVTSNPSATRTANQGYNPTFDLWSTAGRTTSPTTDSTITNVWIKNW